MPPHGACAALLAMPCATVHSSCAESRAGIGDWDLGNEAIAYCHPRLAQPLIFTSLLSKMAGTEDLVSRKTSTSSNLSELDRRSSLATGYNLNEGT